MNRFFSAFRLLFYGLLIAVTFNAYAYKLIPVGPTGGHVAAVAIDPTNSLHLFISINSAGLFESHDGGNSWSRISVDSNRSHYSAIAISPSDSKLILLGSVGKPEVYRSEDGGQSWQPANQDLPFESAIGEISEIAFNPASPSEVVLRVLDQVYLSSDGGKHWASVDMPSMSLDSSVSAIGFTKDGSLAVTITGETLSNDGFYIRSNSDGSWLSLSPTASGGYFDFSVSRQSGDLALVGTDGIWYSTDNGLNWSLRSEGLLDCPGHTPECDPSEKTIVVDRVTFSPQSSNVLFAFQAETPFIWSTQNGGESWVYSGSRYAVNDAVVSSESRLYIATTNRGIVSTDDFGQSWSEPSESLNHSYISDFKLHPETDNQIFVSTFYRGIHFSNNRGTSWIDKNANLIPVAETDELAPFYRSLVKPENLWIDHDNPQLLLASTSLFSMNNGLFRSIDGGEHWSQVTEGLPAPLVVTGLVKTRDSDGILYMGTANNGLYRSLDDGQSWSQVGAMSSNQILSMAIRRLGDLLVIAQADSVSLPQLYISTDGGNSFQLLNVNASGRIDKVFARRGTMNAPIVFVSVEGETDFSGHTTTPAKLYRSLDGGVNFHESSLQLTQSHIADVAISGDNGDRVLVGTGFDLSTAGHHLYLSDDDGENFIAIDNSTTPLDVRKIVISPHYEGEYFVGTYSHGLLKSNIPPTVVIDAPASAKPGEAITLDASKSVDREGSIADFFWEQTSGTPVSLSANNEASVSFVAPSEETVLSFKVTISDEQEETSSKAFEIQISNNQAPIANIRADDVVNFDDTVSLDASESSDSDGSITAYLWEQIDGPQIQLLDNEAVNTSFTAPNVSGDIVIRLTVIDDKGASSSIEKIIHINNPPSIELLAEISTLGGSQVNISAEVQDSDGEVAELLWTQLSGPAISMSQTSTSSVSFTAPNIDSTIQLQLSATDNDGAETSRTVTIKISAQNDDSSDSASATSNGGGSFGMLFVGILCAFVQLRRFRARSSQPWN